MYLHLYHGRLTVDEQLEDWGTDGEYFAIEGFHATYKQVFSFLPKDGDYYCYMEFVDDLFYYDGVYYGDFEILSQLPEGVRESVYNNAAANNYKELDKWRLEK